MATMSTPSSSSSAATSTRLAAHRRGLVARLHARFAAVDAAFIQLALDLTHQREADAARWIASQLTSMRRSKRRAPSSSSSSSSSSDSESESVPTRPASPMLADVSPMPPPVPLKAVVGVLRPAEPRKRSRAASSTTSEVVIIERTSRAVSTTAVVSSKARASRVLAAAEVSPSIAELPAAVLWQIVALWHDVHGVSRANLVLVCRAFRLNLRLWSAFVAVDLQAIAAADVAAVQQYANVVAANDAARAPAKLSRVHPLATLLRDVRRVELRGHGAASGLVDGLLRAIGTLKGVSRCQRDLLLDVTLPGARRRPLRAVNHAQCTGADVGALCGLSLVRCAFSDDALAELGERCAASLETLECADCPQLTGAAIRRWCDLRRPPPLYLLALERCASLSAAHFQRIGALRTLEHLSLRECARVGEPVMMAQIASLPALRSLGLSLTSGTTDRSLQVLFEAQPPSLRTLDVLGNVQVTFDGLYDCVRIAGLECVNARFVAPLDGEDVRVLHEVASGNRVELLVVEEDGPRAEVEEVEQAEDEQVEPIEQSPPQLSSPRPNVAVIDISSDDEENDEFFKSNDDEILHSF